ncbi:MAG: hypothetical protein AAF909_11820 [Pseudomonadota bacterium]
MSAWIYGRADRLLTGAFSGATAMVLAGVLGAGPAHAQSCPGGPNAGPEKCGALISRACLTSLGAGAISAADAQDCQTQLTSYRQCLAEIAESCPRPAAQQTTAESDRLDELARLGGLIETPETAVEFYNNALVYSRRGDLLNGRRMLEKAIAAGATQVDVHQRYAQLLKAQEGLIGAREVMADLVRRAPENRGAALAEAVLRPAPQRRAALEALVAEPDPFAPAYFELAALVSADRVGDQSRADQRAEKAALEAFQKADEAGEVYRWFLEKSAVEVWRESARRRLAAYQNRNLDAAAVSLTSMASNDGWMLTLQIIEVARAIRYSVDGGPVKETGMTAMLHPQTGEPMPRSFFTLPLSVAQAEVQVWYDNIRGEEEGPFPLTFNAADAFVAGAKQVLEGLTQTWVEDRAWDGAQLVYFTHLISYGCGLEKIQYGVERETPDQTFPLGPCDPRNPYAVGENQEIYLTFDPPVSHLTVQLTYANGERSEVRRFDF